MNKELFYKNLELLDNSEIVKTVESDINKAIVGDNKDKLIQYIEDMKYKMKSDKATIDEIKIFIGVLYFNKYFLYTVNSKLKEIFYILDDKDEFVTALTYKGIRDGIGISRSIIVRAYPNIISSKDIIEMVLDKMMNVISKEDFKENLYLIKDNLFPYIDEISRYKYFKDDGYEMNLSQIDFFYSCNSLRRYCEIKDIDFDRMDLFVKTLIPHVVGYNNSLVHSISMLFRLANATKPINNDEYTLLSVLLDSHSFRSKLYEETLADIVIKPDLEESFRKLFKSYISYLSTRSKSVMQNRIGKILSIGLLPEDTFGHILKEELINFDPTNKKISKAIVSMSL